MLFFSSRLDFIEVRAGLISLFLGSEWAYKLNLVNEPSLFLGSERAYKLNLVNVMPSVSFVLAFEFFVTPSYSKCYAFCHEMFALQKWENFENIKHYEENYATSFHGKI